MSSEKRRIFCVITQGELGGAQQFVAQLAQHLDHERFVLHVVWGADSGAALARQLPPPVSHGIVPHLVRSIRPLADTRATWELRHMIADFRPDIVLCISSKAGFVGSLAAHRLRKQLPNMRVIYRIGGWTFNDPWPRWKKRLYLRMEQFSARWKDTIVVNNTHDLEQARSLGIKPRESVIRIYNGIEPYRDFLPRQEARTALESRLPDKDSLWQQQFLVGTIANLYPAKDLVTFIRAAAHVSENVRFVVIGDGPERMRLEREIVEHDLVGRFFLVGRINDAYRYLNAFDVFVLPSVKEGFPWSVLEAMAARVPIVATRVGAIPEMLEDHKSALLVTPGAPDEMARAIVELLESDRLRQELPIQAHQQVISRFSLREMISSYERLFTSS